MTPHNQLNEVWNAVLRRIKETEEINEISFNCWLKPLRAVAVDDRTICLTIDSEFAAKWIDSQYRGVICRNLKKVSAGRITHFKCTHESALGNIGTAIQKGSDLFPLNIVQYTLPNPDYTFDGITVDKHNRPAYMACLAVAEHPGALGNPFSLRGDEGSGKTHMLHAIGNFILETRPDKVIQCVSAEQLNDEWQAARQSGASGNFHAKYSSCDILILDDIQKIIDRDEFQEQLAEIFSELYENGAQIIVSCDMPPYRIPNLHERLISQLIWGSVTEITSVGAPSDQPLQ